MTVFRYIAWRFLVQFAAALAGFMLLLQLLDLFQNANRVMARPGGVSVLLSYLWLRAPLLMVQAVPLAVLIGGMTTFFSFARNNEAVALRAAGLLPHRMLLGPLTAAFAVGALHFALANWIAPQAERRLDAWWAESEAPAPADRAWLAHGSDILSFAHATDEGGSLTDVAIVELGPDGQATRHISARAAIWEDGAWMLREGRTIRIEGANLIASEWSALRWRDGPLPADIRFVEAPTRHTSLGRLIDLASGRISGGESRAYYETRLHKALGLPAVSVLLVLLTASALYGYRRESGFGRGAAMGFVLGFLFLIFDGMLAALGEAGILPPVLAAWTPLALFACLGAASFLFTEE